MPLATTHPDALARSILSCPAAASLVVDGIDDVLAGMDELGMQEVAGVPVFSCPPDVPLARAARGRRHALLTLASGLGRLGDDDRGAVLSLGGTLVSRGLRDCACCEVRREVVELEVGFVLVAHEAPGVDAVRVTAEAFASPRHALNRGLLQRCAEHATACHQEELRRAVSTTAGVRLGDVVGVSLADLTPAGVDVHWVQPDGAHVRPITFPRAAGDIDELGALLRAELHAGLC